MAKNSKTAPSLLSRYRRDIPISIDHISGFVTLENLPWIPKDSLSVRPDDNGQKVLAKRKLGINLFPTQTDDPIRHPKFKLGLGDVIFIDDDTGLSVNATLQATRTLLSRVESFADRYGWTFSENPYLWRCIFEVCKACGDLATSDGNALIGLGKTDGVVKNVAHAILFYDFVRKNHKRMGPHAIALTADLAVRLDFDMAAVATLIGEVVSWSDRAKLTYEQRERIVNEAWDNAKQSLTRLPKCREAFIKLYKQRKASGGNKHCSWLYETKQWKYDEASLFHHDPKAMLALADAFDKDFTAQEVYRRPLKDFVENHADPLIVYKGGVVLRGELIRDAFGGKANVNSRVPSPRHRSRLGSSFTVCPLIAEYFAQRTVCFFDRHFSLYNEIYKQHGVSLDHLSPDNIRAVVAEYTIPKNAIFAVKHERREAEVIVHDTTKLRVNHYDFVLPKGLVIYSQDGVTLMKERLKDPSKSHSKSKGITWSPYLRRRNVTPLLTHLFGREIPTLHKKFQ